jgi:GH24 family phage-related lysozyme (muramidase)|tara:strand:+ start:3258 stop:4034 length:777 start_codon:yes stop_codon:yes gene_type:complete
MSLQYKGLLTTAREEAEMRFQQKGLSGKKRSRFIEEDDDAKLGGIVPKRRSLSNSLGDLEDDFLTEAFNTIFNRGKEIKESVGTKVALLDIPEGDADSSYLITDDIPVGEASGLTEVNDSTAQFIASFENKVKNSYTAYKDGTGYSIGFGTPATKGQVIDKETALSELNSYTKKFEGVVKDANSKHGYQWNDNQVKALTSFAYNTGEGGFNKLIEGGTRGNEEISMMMLKYNKVGNKVNAGLTKRREAEANLFTKTDL